MASADASSPALALETRALRKDYGDRTVLHDLSLEVRAGEVFGFLGPNGAGKTTTIKILLGLVRPTSGTATIFGRPASDPAARREVGYLPETFRFHGWLTGGDLLDFHGRLAGVPDPERHARIGEVLRLVGLDGRGGDRISSYSKGMTQRIGLAQALVSRPRLLLLDEPTSALDPVGRREVRDLIRALRSEGMSIFLNSHLLSEIEMVCDRVAIIDRGRVVSSGRLDDLLGVTCQIQLTLDRVDEALCDLLAEHGEVTEVQDRSVLVQVPTLEETPSIVEDVVRSGYRLFGLVPVHQSLEDVFLGLVEGREEDR